MSLENVIVLGLVDAHWLRQLAASTYCPSQLPWMQRFGDACDMLMEIGGMEAYEHPEELKTIVAYPHGTKRKRPAFIAIHEGSRTVYDEAFHRYKAGLFTIEFVEAGKYGVAGESAQAEHWTEAEDTALLD